MNVREVGPPNGPSILFLHGAGIGSWSWDAVARRLPDYHCLLVDLPEHLHSADAGAFTIPGCADALAAIVGDRAHGGRAHVAGLSLGAQLGVQLLATHGERVARALLTGTNVRGIPGWRFLAPLTAATLPMTRLDWVLRAQARALGIPETDWPAFRADAHHLTAASLRRLADASSAFRIPPGLERAASPTLVVVGEKEAGVILRSASDLAAALPHAQARVARGLDHNWPLAAPELFAATLRAWIEDAPLPDALAPLERAAR